jgi:hypothetical protein
MARGGAPRLSVLYFDAKGKQQCGKKTIYYSRTPHVFPASNAGTYYEAPNGVVEERALEIAEKCRKIPSRARRTVHHSS